MSSPTVERSFLLRRPRLLIGLGGVVFLGPYLVLGPGFFLDDWFALRNVEVGSWIDAAGAEQWRARPGAGLVYVVVFGLLGGHPGLIAFVAACVLVATALVLHTIAGRFLPPLPAFALAGLWLLIPNHTSLETWPSALNISVSLLVVVLAAERLSRRSGRLRDDVLASGFLAVSVLSYEATAPVAVVIVLLAASDRPRSRWLHSTALLAAPTALAGAWMLLNWHPAKRGVGEWMNPSNVLSGHLSTGIAGDNLAGVGLGGALLTVWAISLYRMARPGHRAGVSWPEHLIGAGTALVLLGALPFVHYFYSPVGLGDRVTVVSGVGGAAIVVGAIAVVGRLDPRLGVGLAVVVCLAAVGNRLSLVNDYATAADDGRRILSEVERRWPDPPDEPIVFGPTPVVKRNIVAFIDADWPIQWLYGTRRVSAAFTLSEEAFEDVPPSQRVDIVELSRLPAVDRIAP